MPKKIKLPVFINSSGKISIIQKEVKFKIKRVYFIYDIKGIRGEHKHKKNIQFILALNGSCSLTIVNKNKKINAIYKLKKPNEGVILYPDDWHKITDIKKGTILLVLASEYYSKKDYLKNA